MVHPVYFALPLISMGIAAIYYIIRQNQQQQRMSAEPLVAETVNVSQSGSGISARRNAVRKRNRRGYDEEKECQICQDAEYNVELYPCRHRDVCEKCIDVIITRLDRLCPFCRQYIQGYKTI